MFSGIFVDVINFLGSDLVGVFPCFGYGVPDGSDERLRQRVINLPRFVARETPFWHLFLHRYLSLFAYASGRLDQLFR